MNVATPTRSPWNNRDPLPTPPEQLAGMADEITFLRSRGFLITAGTGDFKGWWKVDGTHRTTEWVRDKAAGLKARTMRNAPAPVVLTGAAPVAIVSPVVARAGGEPEYLPEPVAVAEPAPAKRQFGSPTVDYRGLGPDGVLEALTALVAPAGGITQLAELLGVPRGTLSNVLPGRVKPTAKIVEALYGPTGAVLLPKWLELLAGSPVAVPAPETESLQPPSAPSDLRAIAPAADEQETAAGEGAAASDLSEPLFLRNLPSIELSPASPWSGLEDRDLVAILRGKVAGMAAETADAEAEAVRLYQQAEQMRQRCRALEDRRLSLLSTVMTFEGETPETEKGETDGE